MSRRSSFSLFTFVFPPLWRTAFTGFSALALAGLALPASAAIPNSERAVLEALYNQAGGASWSNNTGWMDAAGTECTWHGITCDGAEDHVIRVSLINNNLSGTLPDLSALTKLQSFAVRINNLSGPIPDLSALTVLNNVHIGDNNLTGSLPALPPSIRDFWANDNDLTGSIPDLSTLTALEIFYVVDNNLTGSIPDLSGLSALRQFAVTFNDLSGPLPALPSSIEEFQAFDNQLSGSIPDLSTLTALVFFDAGRNNLTGLLPALPESIIRFWVDHNMLTGAPVSAPPASLTDAVVCPNYLELSGDNTIDSGWETATGDTPWNRYCASPPAPEAPIAIPTLSGWALALLGMLLGGTAIWRRRNAA